MSNTTDTKKYRLLKEVLNITTGHVVPVGEIFEQLPGTRKYVSKNGWYMAEAACLQKDWFEEVLPVSEPVPEKIEVKFSFATKQEGKFGYDYHLFSTHEIPFNKFLPMGELVESALNDTVVEDNGNGLKEVLGWINAAISAKERFPNDVDFDFTLKTLKNQTEQYLSSLNSKEYKESWAGQQEKVKEEKMKELAKKIYSEQPTNDNAFVWDEKNVIEMLYLIQNKTGWVHSQLCDWMNEFKQSKQSAPEPSALPTKEYEIVDMKHYEDNSIHPYIEKTCFNPSHPPCTIWSVRRLSDNVVFKVGDMVVWKHKELNERIAPIKVFTIMNHDNSIWVSCYNNANDFTSSFLQNLNDVSKPPTPTEPVVEDNPVLFTTEDGVALYKLDNCWILDTEDDSIFQWIKVCKEGMQSSYKLFSTKEAAEEYILLNKPCLSLNDLFLLGITEHHEYYKMMKILAKQKLSK